MLIGLLGQLDLRLHPVDLSLHRPRLTLVRTQQVTNLAHHLVRPAKLVEHPVADRNLLARTVGDKLVRVEVASAAVRVVVPVDCCAHAAPLRPEGLYGTSGRVSSW